MALSLETPVVSSNMGVGLGLYGTVDQYNSALVNNGAQNAVGALYYVNPQPGAQSAITTYGNGSGLWVKYVLYKSTANPATVTGPAPVYWVDETFQTVSGVFSEGAYGGSASVAAGWLLPNTTSIGTSFTNTFLNNGGSGSYVFIALTGFVPGAYITSGSQGNLVYGSSGNWTVTSIADGSNVTHRIMGYVWRTPVTSLGDVLAVLPPF